VIDNFAPTSISNVSVLLFNFYCILFNIIFIIEHKQASLIYPNIGWPQLTLLSSAFIFTSISLNVYLALSVSIANEFNLNSPLS